MFDVHINDVILDIVFLSLFILMYVEVYSPVLNIQISTAESISDLTTGSLYCDIYICVIWETLIFIAIFHPKSF